MESKAGTNEEKPTFYYLKTKSWAKKDVREEGKVILKGEFIIWVKAGFVIENGKKESGPLIVAAEPCLGNLKGHRC